jgi:hypothetical protein
MNNKTLLIIGFFFILACQQEQKTKAENYLERKNKG